MVIIRSPVGSEKGRGPVPGAFTSRMSLWAVGLERSPLLLPEPGNWVPYSPTSLCCWPRAAPGGANIRALQPGLHLGVLSLLRGALSLAGVCSGCRTHRDATLGIIVFHPVMRQALSNLNHEPSKMIHPLCRGVTILKLGTSLPLALTSHPMQKILLNQHSEQSHLHLSDPRTAGPFLFLSPPPLLYKVQTVRHRASSHFKTSLPVIHTY